MKMVEREYNLILTAMCTIGRVLGLIDPVQLGGHRKSLSHCTKTSWVNK